MIGKLTRIIIVALTACMALWGCGDDTQFRVEGTVQGLGTRSIKMTYAVRGTVYESSVTAIDGKFILFGQSKDYTLVELSTAQRPVLARFVARNGETIKCKLDLDDVAYGEITGNDASEEMSDFIASNAANLYNPDSINALVKSYVTDHPDRLSSTALILAFYQTRGHESSADSLLVTIRPESRPEDLTDGFRRMLVTENSAAINSSTRSFILATALDSTEHYYPSRTSASLLYLTAGGPAERRDTVLPVLRALRDRYSAERVRIVEVWCGPDTMAWRRTARGDSLAWNSVWAPAGVATQGIDDLQIPRLPYYVAADSTGRQIYRGESPTRASAVIDSLLNRKR